MADTAASPATPEIITAENAEIAEPPRRRPIFSGVQLNFIPYNFHQGSNDRRQTLQVMVDKNDVVKDYEFSDLSGETNANPFSSTRSEAATTAPSK